MTPQFLTLPVIGKPADVLLNSNQRIHRRVRDERVAYWRDRTELEARNALRTGTLHPVAGRCRILTWMIWPTLARRDPGNWYPTAKAAVDGLVRAGVLVDDNWRMLEGPDMRRWPEKGADSILIEITAPEMERAA